MTVRRLIICMVAVVAISIVNVYHHALSVKHGYRLGRLQAESARLKVSIANLEGEVAMLSSPARLRMENERMQLALVDPGNWREPETAVAYAEVAPSAPTNLLNR
jgi:cell division protein FtsL